MRELFHRIKAARPKWHFQEAELSEVTGKFSNPARGWYQIHRFHADQEPDFAELEWCLDSEDSLALVMINIGAFREQDLSEECLDRIQRILKFFSNYHYDIILRVVYDHEGKALEKEPFFFSQVLGHLRQLGELLHRFADSVFVYQGMLVGNWGEMHTSRFLSSDKLKEMADILRHCKGEQTYLAVRRPVQWRMLHGSQKDSKLSCPDGMGLFDDGIMASENHLGTFGSEARTRVGWEEPWKRADELIFEQELGNLAPCGGEAVYDEAYGKTLTPETVLNELRQMQLSYLNKVYDGKMLDIWRRWKCPVPGVWSKKSLYEYVGAHLGYRFVIQKVSVKPGRDSESRCMVEVKIQNTGFAGFYQEADIFLEYADEDRQYQKINLEDKLRGWSSGEARVLTCELEVCDCDLFLSAQRRWDKAPIRFANPSDKEGRAALGHLGMRGVSK